MKANKIFLLAIAACTLANSCKKDDTESLPVIMNNHFQLTENADSGTFAAVAEGFDKNNDILYYRITGGNNNNAFSIDSLTGIIRVKNSTFIDYESYPTYKLGISVSVKDKPEKTRASEISIDLKNMAIPLSGITSYYSFNNLEDSFSDKSATSSKYTGFFSDRYGLPNEAIEFLGYLSYVILDSAYDFPQRTISFWYNTYFVDTDPLVLFSLDNASLTNGSINIYVKNSSRKDRLFINLSNHLDSIETKIETWNNLVITQNNTNLKIIHNDTLVKEFTLPAFAHASSGNKNIVLGTDQTLKDLFFQGSIDDLFIYNRPLSEKELHILHIEHNLQ